MNYYMERRQNADRPEYPPPFDSIEVMLEQAFSCLQDNCYAEAAAIYEEVLKVETDNSQAGFNLGLIRRINGELPEAIACFKAVLECEPDNVEVLARLGDAYRDQGSWDQAAVVYQRALKQTPGDVDLNYSLGLVHYHRGEPAAAIGCYQKALELDRGHADAYYNLGVVHFEQGDYDRAADSYERALSVRPDDIDTHYNLAVTRSGQGDFAGAADHYRTALALDPDDAELHNGLGLVYRQLNELEKAEACYRRALALRPDYGAACTNLAVVLQTGDRIEQAIACYARAVELGHQAESADYMVAALSGADRDTAPRDYVRALFDSYAENFDHRLTRVLGYNSPTLLREMAGGLLMPGRNFLKAADLGCGTGLVGSCFRDIADHLIGVDLSAKMLDKAAAKDVYDELYCADILEFLAAGHRGFDLVVAADVLIYIGALEPFFAAVKKCLAPSGHLMLTVEKHEGEGERRLRASGRYAYASQYIERLACSHGLMVKSCREVDLRKEKDLWLRGCLFVLQNT
ncbi:MAG: tetratricopeptide repeat protein [Desulfurivibrionaceae bacterium]|nr:tetratricopeptide repeat protein [Desulfurivibrionaceae bacterium]